jgi:polyhydroxyalkanoate synthase
MDEWISKWSSDAEDAPTPTAKKTAARKKAATKKAAAKKSAAKKSAAKKSPTREAIGTNPSRRYGSAGSRSLSR